MRGQEAVNMSGGSEIPKLSSGDPFVELAQELQSEIAARAHELFEARGGAHGSDRDDWLRAQAEILVNVPLLVTETEAELIVRADVPGIAEDDLEVRVAPRAICIMGKRRLIDSPAGEQIVYSERSADRIFRTLTLPTEVDAQTADAVLENGLLEIRLLKAASGKKILVRSRAASA